jgi:hypothetical protein
MGKIGISSALVLAALASSGLFSCSSSEPAATGAGSTSSSSGGPATGPTFHKDIEPILQKACQSCHSPGNIAPFSLMQYADAKTVAGLVAKVTQARTMPPWAAFDTDECKTRFGWKDDHRLTDAEIALIDAWSTAGAPEGDPKDAPAPFDPKPAGLSNKDKTVEPLKPYTTTGDKDQFRCFVLDPGLTADAYLNGTNIIAGDPKVVHHALVFLDDQNQSAALADADGGYDCFGGPGIDGALIAAWAPGGIPAEMPPNVGTKLPKGSKLVMQIHYHPAGASGTDSTKFEMRFTKQTPEYTGVVALIGNFEGPVGKGDGLLPGPDDASGVQFKIPANAKNHTETMRYTLPAKIGGQPLPELKVYGVATHMHYVGTDMKLDVTRANPGAEPADECLLETPRWDFNWQRFYAYDVPIEQLPTLHAGDVLGMRCTYDNSMDNPFVKRALSEQHLPSPVDVSLGETTLDEMCLGAYLLVYKN